jgi:hypothetical protein
MSMPSMLVLAVFSLAQLTSQTQTPATSVVGYLRDSACVHRFHEVTKPLPNGCVEACVRGGSPLVILTPDQHVYHPISPEMPESDLRAKLLPFVGKLVKITGPTFTRGGSTAVAVEHVEEVKQ